MYPKLGFLVRKNAIGNPGTDVMILEIFSPKNFAKNWRFLLKAKLNYAKI
jgi:hypothetical protein